MNRALLLISTIWVAMLLTPTVAAAETEIVLIEKEIDDDHIIIEFISIYDMLCLQ